MLIETFSSGNSWLHTMDTRCKLVAAASFSVATALLSSISGAMIALALAVLLLLSCQLPALLLCKRLFFMNIFIAFLWLFLPFTIEGTIIWTAGPLTAFAEGIVLATLISLKCNAILMAIIALTGTSTITAIGQGLGALYIPQKIVLLLLFTWRYVHVLQEEYQRLLTAAKMRGFIPATTMHTYRTYANLTAMVLVKSLDRAERIDNAMRMRGFSGSFHTLSPQAPTFVHITFVCIFLLIAIALPYLDTIGVFSHLDNMLHSINSIPHWTH